MIEVFNIIFFGCLFRIIGGHFTKPGTDENAVPRYISLPIGFAWLALQMYDEPVKLAAFIYVFVIVRLLPTVPLLDATYPNYNDFWTGIKRNLWIAPALPFSSYWLVLLVPQVLIYYYAAKLQRKYPKIKAVTTSELVSGFIYGACV